MLTDGRVAAGDVARVGAGLECRLPVRLWNPREPFACPDDIRHREHVDQRAVHATIVELDIVASTVTDPKWKQWKWMKRYRLWEANRKVFLELADLGHAALEAAAELAGTACEQNDQRVVDHA